MLDHPCFGQVPLITGGGDPLGTAPVNEMLYRTTFPAVNNVIEYIRVYSALCWMIGVIQEAASQNRSKPLVELTNIGLEKIQLLISWHSWGQGLKGVAGNGRVYRKDAVPVELRFHKLLDNNARIALEVDPEAEIGQGAHFLQPAQYRPSLVNGFAFLKVSRKFPGTYHLTKAGKEMAAAYENAIHKHPLRDWLADLCENFASYDEVKKMTEMLNLLEPSEKEKESFLKHYYPAADYRFRTPNWRNRHAGLTLTLRALAAETSGTSQSKGRSVSMDVVRHTMASGIARNGMPLDLTHLEGIQGIWSSLQLRQVFRKAMDVLVRCVESWIKDAEIYQRPRQIQDCARDIGQKLEQSLPKEHCSTVSEAITMFEGLRGAFPSMGAAAITVPQLSLWKRQEALRNLEKFNPRSKEETEALSVTYYTLLFCMLEVESLEKNPHFLLQHKGTEDLPLGPFCKLLRSFENKSPAQLMAHVVQHSVISQHFKVVRRRTEDFRNRFRFMNGDSGLECALHVGSLYEPFELQDLLEHALYLLTQCGLVDRDGDGLFAITKEGIERLAEYKPPLSAEKIDELIAQDREVDTDDDDTFEEYGDDPEMEEVA
jgi:hypothetical protein